MTPYVGLRFYCKLPGRAALLCEIVQIRDDEMIRYQPVVDDEISDEFAGEVHVNFFDRLVAPHLQSLSGKDVFSWRKRLGLDQSQAAKILGITPRLITYYEAGDRKVTWRTTVACYAFEHWPHLRAMIPELLAKGERGGRRLQTRAQQC